MSPPGYLPGFSIALNYSGGFGNSVVNSWPRLSRATVADHRELDYIETKLLIAALRLLGCFALSLRHVRRRRRMSRHAYYVEDMLGEVHLLTAELPGSPIRVGDIVAARVGVLLQAAGDVDLKWRASCLARFRLAVLHVALSQQRQRRQAYEQQSGPSQCELCP